MTASDKPIGAKKYDELGACTDDDTSRNNKGLSHTGQTQENQEPMKIGSYYRRPRIRMNASFPENSY